MSSPLPSVRPGRPPVPLAPRIARERNLGTPLPVPLTPLIGRERIVERIREALLRDDVRLLTLTGPGGVGKTRLALRVALDLVSEFADGVAFVPLAAVSEPGLVASAIARALGMQEAGDRPLAERLRTHLRDKHRLLLLDNFEQVVEAAPLVAELLTACPRLKALVTSRARLRVSGERTVPVPPLALPDRGAREGVLGIEPAASPAVRLFAERAQAIDPGFAITSDNVAAVTDVCRRLDGLPLAIELAAPWVAVLSPQAIAARLERRLPLLAHGRRDLPTRQQTMRDAIAWSHDLLPPEEQRLFQRLAVFAGGCTLEAATTVCAAGTSGIDLVAGVAALVDKSLLSAVQQPDGEPRFAMLETVREYGLERLEASGEAEETRRRHAAWCLALAEEAETAFAGRDPRRWGERLERELDNFRAALAWLAGAGAAEAALRLASALEPLWWVLGHTREGSRWLGWALAESDHAPAELRAKAAVLAGRLAKDQGDYALARRLVEEGLTRATEVDDVAGVARSLSLLGTIAKEQGDQAAARARYEEALARFRSQGDLVRTAAVLCNLATLGNLGTVDRPGARADQERAAAYCQEALEIARALGHQAGVAQALHGLAYVAYKARDYPRAVELSRDTLALRREIRDIWGIAPSLEDLADIAGMTGQAEQAARLYGAAEALREEIGVPVPPNHRPEYEREVAVARAALSPAAFAAAWAAGRALPLDEAIAEALAVAVPEARAMPAPDRAVPATAGLTDRELEVLRLLVAGRTDRQIADALFISPRTAQNHVARIFAKLGVNSRTAAATVALTAGLLADPPTVP